MRSAADVQPALPEWVWPGRIPRGAITLLVGEGGVGKTTLAVELAAQLTTAALSGKPERVCLALQEDDEAAVTVPKLRAAAANLDLVDLDGERGWRFPRDLLRLSEYASAQHPGLVVIDPLDASVPALAHQSARAALDDLASLARRYDFAVLALHHLTKTGRGVMGRIGGGRAVTAISRSVLALARMDLIGRIVLDLPTDEDLLVLSHVKSNYGLETDALMFERQSEPHPLDGAASIPRLYDRGPLGDVPAELVNADQRERGWRYRTACIAIERFLLRGAMPAEDLAADVTALEITERTFERARADLRDQGVVETYQDSGRWWWRLRVPDAVPSDFEEGSPD